MPDAKVLGLFRSFKGTLHCWQLVQPAKAGTLIERYIDMGMWNNVVNSGFTSFLPIPDRILLDGGLKNL